MKSLKMSCQLDYLKAYLISSLAARTKNLNQFDFYLYVTTNNRWCRRVYKYL